jgi:hypothetical protein
MAYYKWERVIDTRIREYGVSGIMAIGHTGLYRPVENRKLDTNIFFSSCVPYYDGYLLIAPGIVVYSDINGHSSETKMTLRLIDGAFCNGMIILGTEDGQILVGKDKLLFQEYPRTMKSIKRINACVDKIILCGDGQISIMWMKDNTIQYSAIGSPYNFINAFIYRNTIYALSTDGYLNVYFVNDDMKVISDVYRVNVLKSLKDVEIYNMYVDAGKTTDIYFLCSAGEVALIPDFNYTSDTIKDIGDNLLLYAAKLTNDSFFKDMIKYDNKHIIVGYGEETKSCVQVPMLKTSIIEHNILGDISGAERSVYNYSTVYENKYIADGGKLSDLRCIVTRDIPVRNDNNGNYISQDDISVDGFYADVIEVHNAIDDNGWINNKIYVNAKDTTKVVLSVDTSRRV